MSDTNGVSKEEAARLLGCSVRTVERRIRAGELDTTILHTRRGPRVRVHLPQPPPVVEAAFVATPTPDGAVVVTHDAGTSFTPTPEGVELATLALRALDEAMRENARLRAMLESRRPWWRRVGERLRRRR